MVFRDILCGMLRQAAFPSAFGQATAATPQLFAATDYSAIAPSRKGCAGCVHISKLANPKMKMGTMKLE